MQVVVARARREERRARRAEGEYVHAGRGAPCLEVDDGASAVRGEAVDDEIAVAVEPRQGIESMAMLPRVESFSRMLLCSTVPVAASPV